MIIEQLIDLNKEYNRAKSMIVRDVNEEQSIKSYHIQAPGRNYKQQGN